MELTSVAFENNDTIPEQYSYEKGNMSPPLMWSEIPEGTQSFALIMDDPDAASVIGRTFDHWVLYNIPNTILEISESLPRLSIVESIGTQGITTRGELGYMGPCPPKGAGAHKYIFQLYALSLVPGLQAGLSKDEVLSIIENHVLANARLTGLFSS